MVKSIRKEQKNLPENGKIFILRQDLSISNNISAVHKNSSTTYQLQVLSDTTYIRKKPEGK